MRNSIDNTVDDVPVVQGVKKIIDIILRKPELTWAALIDTAFDYEGDARPDFGTLINCYDHFELEGLSTVAPCLIALAPESGLRRQLTGLIKHCQGRPMLSFVGTTGNIKDISAGWRLLHMVSVIDEQEMLLRFADTRILSYLPQVLTPSQWRTLCGTLSCWAYFDRSGRLVICNIPNVDWSTEKLSITKEQLEKLLDASHPDMLMALIAESMSDIIPADGSVSERYHMIKDSFELARRNEVKDNSDILALAVAAYLTKGKSNIDQRLQSMLRQHAWSTGLLGDAIVDAGIVEDEQI